MRGEARHVEEKGTVVETRIVWHQPLVGPEREELEKKLAEIGVLFFPVPVEEPKS